MSRYTVILFDNERLFSINNYKDKLSAINTYIKYYEKYGSLPYEIQSGLILLLSNGLNKEMHRELYNNLNTLIPGIKLVSVTHHNPIYALIKASKIIEYEKFYYEEGEELEYNIGYFTILLTHHDLLTRLANSLKAVSNIIQILINTGSLILSIDTKSVLAALSKNAISSLSTLTNVFHMNMGVDYLASKAVEKATSKWMGTKVNAENRVSKT